LLVLLCMSAVAVYYLGEEQAGTIAALLHLALGIALLGPFGWHWLRGYRSRRHHGPAV
jgi:multisubunit Na+/H+ antiporter MnhG subunit